MGAVSQPSPAARVVMSSGDVSRAVRRVAHEILERNKGAQDLVVLGTSAYRRADKATGRPNAFALGFSPPPEGRADQPGRAWFTLSSGRKVETIVLPVLRARRHDSAAW